MFTGIIKKIVPIIKKTFENEILRYSISCSKDFLRDLEEGASVAVDGVCQTVVEIQPPFVFFEAVSETLEKTTLYRLAANDFVNLERSVRFGEEIGGHLLSGHIMGKAKIERIEKEGNSAKFFFSIEKNITQYLFSKGFIALNGASLTLVDVILEKNIFSVHLIPETLNRTTFKNKKIGDEVNVEIDSQTQILVETAHRFLKS